MPLQTLIMYIVNWYKTHKNISSDPRKGKMKDNDPNYVKSVGLRVCSGTLTPHRDQN